MFYNIDDIKIDKSDNNEYKYLESYKSVNVNLFSLDENNEIHGKLYFYKNNLIALDFYKDSININSYNIGSNLLKNIATINSNNCFFDDRFGIVYYINNGNIKEININDY